MNLNESAFASDQSIFLTGASGALGRAIALQHAREGVALQLWGRNRERLNLTCQAMQAKGASAQGTSLDLADAEVAVEKLLRQDEIEKFDLAYLVAGIGETRAFGDLVETPGLILEAARTNFAAPAAMATALAGRMAQRGGGRIVLIGSAAGHHSLPFASAYAGSKAGLARFADALRLAVKPYGVGVTHAAPGFLDTPSAQASARGLPFTISVEEAARRIVRAGQKGKRHYVTPWQFAALRAVDALLPGAVRDRLLMRLQP